MEEHTESKPPNVGYKRKKNTPEDYKTSEERRMRYATYRNNERGNQMAEVLAKRYEEKAERDRKYEEKQKEKEKEINDAAETLVTMKNTPNMKIGGKKTRRKRNNKRKKSRKNK